MKIKVIGEFLGSCFTKEVEAEFKDGYYILAEPVRIDCDCGLGGCYIDIDEIPEDVVEDGVAYL